MSDAALNILPMADAPDSGAEPAAAGKARRALARRLADVVCLPGSRVNAFERAMTADLLVEMLRDGDATDRLRASRRMAGLTEIPYSVLRLLLRDDIQISAPLLEDSTAIPDSELIMCAREASIGHRHMIAARRELGEMVVEALVDIGEPDVIERVLLNAGARFSASAIEKVTAISRDHPNLVGPLLRRGELRPSHAYVMFWWCDPDARRTVLQRFAVSREVLQEAAADVFPMAMAEQWQDPLVRKALQFIERRQRNRAAIDRSPFESLDDAVAAAQNGFNRDLVAEISYLSGIKPTTGAKIFTDPFGEPIAVLCKATGLPRTAVRALWRGLRRPETDEAGNLAPALERTLITYDMMAVDRAQTVLRYWNWSLSSELTPALIKAIREGDVAAIDEYSAPQRAAMLALSGEFRGGV